MLELSRDQMILKCYLLKIIYILTNELIEEGLIYFFVFLFGDLMLLYLHLLNQLVFYTLINILRCFHVYISLPHSEEGEGGYNFLLSTTWALLP